VARKTPQPEQPPFDFEQGLGELESLVERMEHGELSLEQSLKDFERGIELFRRCQQALQGAEQKVQVLIERSGRASLEPFTPEEE
jgi:exodeoxyribonuclease VII small subunit